MAAVRSENTKPEIAARMLLRKSGYKYRSQYGKERIDFAILDKKLAIFIDGCFWHMCPKHAHFPKSNKSYWRPKLKKNMERDKAKNRRLKSAGWSVVRIWEHQLKTPDIVFKKLERVKQG